MSTRMGGDGPPQEPVLQSPQDARVPPADAAPAGNAGSRMRTARYRIGDVVRHRLFPFRGVIFDVDTVFNNTEEWLMAIPEEMRPSRDQPFYHLLAENAQTTYVAYVSEQNLLPDSEGGPVKHPQVDEVFQGYVDGRYVPRSRPVH